jgi:dTDP-4-amino-4,6-dideoxygalactose transaminase
MNKIPFNVPYLAPDSLNNLDQVLQSRNYSGEGIFTKTAETFITEKVQGLGSLLTGSCTDALELASLLCEFKPGDEVILPSFNFTSGAISIVNTGAVPVFVDIDSEDLNISIPAIKSALTDKTRAISFINYAGFQNKGPQLKQIATDEKLFLIEDNAHGFDGFTPFGKLGSIGDFSVQSFHETKNVNCGEGGSISIFKQSFLDRAYTLRQKGTNRKSYIEGKVNKYQWVDKGSSFLPSEFQAALLVSQFASLNIIQERRTKIWDAYFFGLSDLVLSRGHYLPPRYSDYYHTSHLFYILFNNPNTRRHFTDYMKSMGVDCPFHYQPLHSSPAGKKWGRFSGSMKNTEIAAENLARLPIYPDLSDESVDRVIELTRGFLLNEEV